MKKEKKYTTEEFEEKINIIIDTEDDEEIIEEIADGFLNSSDINQPAKEKQ